MKKPINKISKEDIEAFDMFPFMNAYQHIAGRSAVYPGQGTPLGLLYCALKLAGEAGELCQHLGKAMRDDGWIDIKRAHEHHPDSTLEADGWTYWITFREFTTEREQALVHELGDIQWYVAALAKELGYVLSMIASQNLEKLHDRAERGRLQGSGDSR